MFYLRLLYMLQITHINMREGCHMKIEAGKRYMITRDAKGVITRFPVTVTSVTERSDYYYVGYTPDDFRICRWGYTRVKKEGRYQGINDTFEEM